MKASYNLGHNVPAAFQQPDHGGLVALETRPFALDRAANQRFVNLDNSPHAAKRIVAIKRPHVLADLVAHAPSSFVSHPKLALNFLRCHAVPRSAEEEHDKEPIAQRCASAVKRCSGCWIDLVPAILAYISTARGNSIVVRAFTATRTVVAVAKAITHDVFKAGFLGWKSGLKLAKGGGFRFYTNYIAQVTKCRKGIITKQVQGDDSY
jgi:hypothetical protein